MRTFKSFLAMLLLLSGIAATAQTKTVDHFTKVIVSPYIQVTFVEGDEESVTINNITVDESKLHLEVNSQTLRIYLEGAKDFPKYEKDRSSGYDESHPLYQNTSVVVTVTYKTLTDLSLRGEEEQLCKSVIDAAKFTLKIYGESEVTFNELNAAELETTIYGEASLNIKAGTVTDQQYTCYGEGRINSMSITGKTRRVIAYGEADVKLNVSDKIKITAYGDARLHYKGDPAIVKGIHFGDMLIDKMD
ncbi:hypothetical protein BH10BAC2_BH10BAC2_17610 [soil metagenome]